MTELLNYLWIDFFCVSICICLVFKNLFFVHPITQYLFFHLYSFTWRAWALYFGAPPMYSHSSFYEVITSEELSRALLYADFGLVSICLGSFFIKFRPSFFDFRKFFRLATARPPTLAKPRTCRFELAWEILFWPLRRTAMTCQNP